MNGDKVARKMEAVRGQVADLERSARESSEPEHSLPPEAFEEIQATLEELRVAEEELREQNEELTATALALAAEQQRYHELFEFAPDGYLVTDAKGTIREANRAAGVLLRRPTRFLIGKPLATFVESEHTREFRSELLRRLQAAETPEPPASAAEQTGQPAPREWIASLRPREGAPFEAALTIAPVRGADGKIASVRWLVRDITERRQAEARVRALNADLEQRVLHRTAELEAANRSKDESLDRERAARAEAEALHRRVAFLAEASRILAASLDFEATLTSIARLAIPDFADWCTVDMLQEDGSLRAVAVAHIDPERETLVREVRQHYPPMPDPVHGIWRVLRSGQPALLLEVTDAQREADSRDARHLELLHKIGTRSLLRVPLQARGRVLGVLSFGSMRADCYAPADLAMAEDLGNRAALAVDNARVYREAQEASAAKDRFLAVLSHELRTPLTPIQASVELLRRTAGDPARVTRAAEVIERNVRLQASLVNDLLDLSRITQGKVSLDTRPVALVGLLGQTLDGLRAEAEAAGLSLTWEPPEAEIHGELDPLRIQQIVLNLVTNAIKYTLPGGRIAVSLSRRGDTAQLVIADSGIGISPEALPLIFEMFHQERVPVRDGDAKRKEQSPETTYVVPYPAARPQGLGIGLALVQSLVRLHGGKVWAESEGLARGSRFIVELPLKTEDGGPETGDRGRETEDGELRPPSPVPGLPSPVFRAPSPVSRPGVLLVEDSADSRETLAEVLDLLGYEVREAESAEQALEILAGWRPDAILSDLGLPRIDGYELMRRVRRMPEQADVVALAVSGYGAREDRDQALAAGFDAHIAKPLDIETLDRQLRELLGGRVMRDA